ncbi:uncharacterized protein LOC62_04G005339 [Vanrija pseudolonga]|uniref:Uncharacterized protein n=1 Tax=Vanrija pseudolonga TaxID=143232 RepID=A0AAF1BI29_9TREE|nr:hypothetical protein LOC62_04G005339 [Vanrija pseudolonga]
MPVTIDSKTYPDIIDCIIRHACVPVLLAMSATSKEFNERIIRGGRFTRHALVGETITTVETSAVETVATRRLALADRYSRELLPFVPRAIEILDLAGSEEFLTRTRCALFRNVKIIRRKRGAWSRKCIDDFPQLDTLVDFIDLCNLTDRHYPVIHVPTTHQPGVFVTNIQYSPDVVMRDGLTFEGNTDGGIYAIELDPTIGRAGQPYDILYPLLSSILAKWQGKTALSIIISGMLKVAKDNRELGVHHLVDNLRAYVEVRTLHSGTPVEKSPLWWRHPALVSKVTRSIRFVTSFYWCLELGDRAHVHCLWH